MDETAVRESPVEEDPPCPEPALSPVEPPPSPPEPNTPPVAAAVPETEEAWLGLRRSDRVVLGVLAAVCLALSCWHWAWLSGWGLKPIEIDRPPERRFDYRLDVNTATWVEWMQLPGIGDTLARRIVADRQQRGPFRSIEDVGRVKGIGTKTLDKLRPWLTVTPAGKSEPRRKGASGDGVRNAPLRSRL